MDKVQVQITNLQPITVILPNLPFLAMLHFFFNQPYHHHGSLSKNILACYREIIHNANVDKNVEQKSYSATEALKLYSHLENSLVVSYDITHTVSYDPVIPILRSYPREMSPYIYKRDVQEYL